MNDFDHEKLDVFKVAIKWVLLSEQFSNQFPRGNFYLRDQLQRAATSIPFNIAEGAGEFAPLEKSRFYRIAKRSTTECAAILEVCFQLKFVDKLVYCEARELLLRIVAMLTKLVKKTEIKI